MESTSFFSILFSLYCSANPGESKRLFRREKIFMDFLMICDIIALSLRPVLQVRAPHVTMERMITDGTFCFRPLGELLRQYAEIH